MYHDTQAPAALYGGQIVPCCNPATTCTTTLKSKIHSSFKMPKNRSYTVTFKLQVIQWHRQNGGNVSETARNFNVDRKRVREWMGQEDCTQGIVSLTSSQKKKKHGTI